MRVRMLASISGTRNGRAWPDRGGEIDVGDEEGAQLCDQGLALPVPEPEEPERAVAPQATVESRPAPRDVRAWARANDVDVPARGTIPRDVVDAYLAARAE